jgi:hypothetical protein
MPAHRKIRPQSKKKLLEARPTGKLQDEFLTEQELADLCGRTVRTVRWWRKMRIGPPRITFNQVILYRRASVINWLLKFEEQPTR